MPSEGGRRAGLKTYETNEAGDAIIKIEPTESVYSFLFFMAPIEELREPGKLTTSKMLAWLVVIVALVLQGVIIYAVWEVIVMGGAKWQLSVVRPATTGNACNDGSSLCQKLPNGMVSCAPPSVQLSGRWDELDTDGDGNWTREEAQAAASDLYCKYHVNAVEVFDVFVTFLVNRENIIWIHPEVRAGKGIPKSYFRYAAGDIIMCGYRNKDMCPNLLQRGFFDAPLEHGTVPRVGTTISSALKYCYSMLDDGGICDRTLPSTYTVWKKSSQDQCYGSGFDKFTYEHPVSRATKTMLAVNYAATQDYQKAERDYLFLIYKMSVIMVLLCSVFSDLKEIVPLATFVTSFPSAEELEQQGLASIEIEVDKSDDDNVQYTIKGITKMHRVSLFFVIMARIIMFFVLLVVGVIFLLRETDYLNLILNGLGLLFIVVLPTDLYHQLLNPYLRAKVENVQPVEVRMPGIKFMNTNPALKDIVWLCVMALVLALSMYTYTAFILQPVTEALSCACLSEGPHCREAKSFSRGFWDNYWQFEVPEMIGDIKQHEWEYGNLTDEPPEEGFRRPTSWQGNFKSEHGNFNSEHVRRSGRHTNRPRESLLGSSAEVPEVIGSTRELEHVAVTTMGMANETQDAASGKGEAYTEHARHSPDAVHRGKRTNRLRESAPDHMRYRHAWPGGHH